MAMKIHGRLYYWQEWEILIYAKEEKYAFFMC